MKKLVLIVAIAITLISFDSYSQSSFVEDYFKVKNENTLKLEQQAENRRKRDEQLEDLFSRPLDLSSNYKQIEVNTNLDPDGYYKSKKKQPFKGMTIKELSELHAVPSTGFGSIPESVSGTELLKSKNSGNRHFKRAK